MTLSEVGRVGQLVDPLNGGDVAADGTLLSVAEIQARFREERARQGLATPTNDQAATSPAEAHKNLTVDVLAAPAATAASVSAAAQITAHTPDESAAVPAPRAERSERALTQARADQPPTSAPSAGRDLEIPPRWVRVIAGHSGAGSSTTALALCDAAVAAGHRVQLIEAAAASRSGLVGAASAELGLDETGAWRRGTRGQPTLLGALTITRRAEDSQPTGWPRDTDAPDGDTASAAGQPDSLVAVDLGLVPTDALDRLGDGPIVIACRATVPGVRLAEQLLARLADAPVVVAMLGQRRWPGEVTSSSGPRMRSLRDAGRVVTVPIDAYLAISGPTYVPLPKAVVAAGRVLMGLISAAQSGSAGAPPNPTAQSAPRQKGTTR